MHRPFYSHPLLSNTQSSSSDSSSIVPSILSKKDQIGASLLVDDSIYLGTEQGDLIVLDLIHSPTNSIDHLTSTPTVALSNRKDRLVKKPIDQLAFVKELNALVCLSGGDLSLFSLPDLAPTSPFSQYTKASCSLFTRTTCILTPNPLDSSAPTSPPSIHTVLALACRRRLIFLYWIDGIWITSNEIALPHQIRGMSFTNDELLTSATPSIELFAGFSTGEYGIVRVPLQSNSKALSASSTNRKTAVPTGPVSGGAVKDQPSLGDLFSAPTPITPASGSNNTAIATGASTSGTTTDEPSTSATTSGTGTSGSLSRATGGALLGGLGTSLGLGSLTTKKIDKNDVVSVPRGKLRRANGSGYDRKGKSIRTVSTEEDWLVGKEWGWSDDEEDQDERDTSNTTGAGRNQKGRRRREAQVVVVRDNHAQLLPSSTGGQSRAPDMYSATSINYSATVEETIVSPPYLISLLANSTLVVHTSDSLVFVQTINWSPLPLSSSSAPSNTTLRLLTLSDLSPTPPFLILSTSTPNTSNASSLATQTLHIIQSKPWATQVEDLGEKEGSWSLATRLYRLGLPFLSPPQSIPSDLSHRLAVLRSLHLFEEGQYEMAVDAFIKLDLSVVKVVGLYEEGISGRLWLKDAREKEQVFGGRKQTARVDPDEGQVGTTSDVSTDVERDVNEKEAMTEEAVAKSPPGRLHSLATRLRDSTTGAVGSGHHHSRDPSSRSSSVDSSRTKGTLPTGKKQFDQSIDELVRYLTDRRQQYSRALAALLPSMRPSPTSFSTSQQRIGLGRDELYKTPDGPISALNPDQLANVAQVVDTTLFKSYLKTKPVMVGPLCRIDNWCVVEEVEELLLAVKKYQELLDLYNGKDLHEKAVKLLRRMSEEEDDPLEKVDPTVRYLQKLGSSHLETIFSASEWVFSISKKKGLEIFVADLEEVESLPRHETMHHLEKIGKSATIGYLKHIIHALGEQGSEFHEKLIELYLDGIKDTNGATISYQDDLLSFLESSTSYRADRVLGRLPTSPTTLSSEQDPLSLIRAVLLGRLGRHEGALRIYIYQLDSPSSAEEYCRRVSATEPEIFHLLLRIYLRPKADHPLLFKPALDVIAKYANLIDPIVVFDLLPPLVSVSELETFLNKTLRRSVEQKRDQMVLKGIAKSLSDQNSREVMRLESRRVRIGEGRVCPVCGKRLGNSVLSIHNPRGEVVHYQCREAFQESRKDLG